MTLARLSPTWQLLLVGFLLLLPQRLAYLRLIVAVVLSIAHIVLLLAAKPYRQKSTAFFALAVSISLLSTLFAALQVKVQSSLLWWQKKQLFGAMDVYGITLFILVANFLVISVALVLLIGALHREAHQPRLRLTETGREPELTLKAHHRYHVFLSHRWDSQDSVAVLKRQLQRMLPGIKVFLDKDDMESIEKLEVRTRALLPAPARQRTASTQAV